MLATGTTFQALEPETRKLNAAKLEYLVVNDLPRFYRQAYRQLGNPHDAEDAIQDALVSAWKNVSQFKGRAQLSTWFMAIVINAARMRRRRKRPLVSFEEQISSREDGMTLFDTCEDNHPGPEEACAQSELRNLLAKAINRLSPASRRAIRNYLDGMTAAEASMALGVAVGTIKAQLSRARAKLAQSLRQELRLQVPTPSRINRTLIAQ
jgi:RNA polymerase sigma-70 factor (ECF subfamily)